MGKCINHPENETPYICMKHNLYLCEACLECKDPDIYCKFRPSCPIWFMTKRKARLVREEEEKTAALQASLQVNFGPDGKTVRVPKGTTLLEAARMAEVHINASCNGKGACGKCKLMVTAGRTENPSTPLLSDTEKEKGYILACQSKVVEDVSVEVPPEILERKLKVAGMGKEATERLKGLVEEFDPMLKEIPLELSPPTIEDSVSILTLKRRLASACCRISDAPSSPTRGTVPSPGLTWRCSQARTVRRHVKSATP